jgi:hypothetical protein
MCIGDICAEALRKTVDFFHDKRSAGRALNTRPPVHEAGRPTVWRVFNSRHKQFCGLHTRGATKEMPFGTAAVTVMTRVIWRTWRRTSGEWCGRRDRVVGVDTCKNGGSLEYEICCSEWNLSKSSLKTWWFLISTWNTPLFLEPAGPLSYQNNPLCTAFSATQTHYTVFLKAHANP